jgi:DNA-binding response OmpR family regulator
MIIDDDRGLLDSLESYFCAHGHVVDSCESAEDAEQLLSLYEYDVIVLDWNLPGMDGNQFCRNYRAKGGQTPVIFLTGNDSINFLETGLGSGGDDYLIKPFDIRELNARVKTLLSRRLGNIVPYLNVGELVLHPERNSISVQGQSVKLRSKEVSLLEFLMRHPNRIFSAQELVDNVWPADSAVGTNSVRTWMGLLRKKLAEVGQENLIRTILGAGYILDKK